MAACLPHTNHIAFQLHTASHLLTITEWSARCGASLAPSAQSPPVHPCTTRHRVKLKAFKKFEDTAEAVQSATALVEGKLSSTMKKFLKKNVVGDSLKVRAVYL
eukprot:scaffold261413_cov39-Tisochrysis_lutea.AAC.3